MSPEYKEYRFKISEGDDSKEILVSAPTSLAPDSVRIAIINFCKDSMVRENLIKSESTKPVVVIATGNRPQKVIGITIPNGESDV